MTNPARDGWPVAAGTLGAAFALGQALQQSNGASHPISFRWLGFALGCFLAAALFARQGLEWTAARRRLAVGLVGLGVLVQLDAFGGTPPAIYLQNTNIWEFTSRLVVFGALVAALVVAATTRVRRWWVFGLLALGAFVALCRWLIEKSPNPIIDVFSFTNEAIDSLKRGVTPYAADNKFRNIYGHTQFYGTRIADNQWIYSGFGYPPMSLLFSAAGRAFGGDLRWANVACFTLMGAAFIWNRASFGVAAAALLLTTPRMLFMLEQCWTDAYILGMLGVVLWSATRWRRPLPYLLAILFSLKQYMVFWLPLVPLLFDPAWSRKELLRFLGKVVATGLLINLPWVLWDVNVLRALTNEGDLPFRLDALSFLAMTAKDGQPTLPLRLPYLLMLLSLALVWWRGPRGASGFALGGALTMSLFFSFSKHAFCNHHFLSLGAACAALAFVRTGEDESGTPATS